MNIIENRITRWHDCINRNLFYTTVWFREYAILAGKDGSCIKPVFVRMGWRKNSNGRKFHIFAKGRAMKANDLADITTDHKEIN